ncbi:unnamed protein product, partial [Gulo gulo]
MAEMPSLPTEEPSPGSDRTTGVQIVTSSLEITGRLRNWGLQVASVPLTSPPPSVSSL